MEILEIILPVLVMVALGIVCRKKKLLNQNGIDNMKILVTNIMLPTAIFHALATAEYSRKTGILVLIMFVMLVISFGIGFLLKPLMEETYRKYLPFMVCVYEGGMMGYPLYTSLCGSENLSQIAVLDIAGLLFGFSVYMGLLGQTENGEKFNIKALFVSALKTPAFMASVLGIIAGLSGVINRLIAGPAGGTYLSVENILTGSDQTMYQDYCNENMSAGSNDGRRSVCSEMLCGKLQTFESGSCYVYVVTGHFQSTDVFEEKREQCICIDY